MKMGKVIELGLFGDSPPMPPSPPHFHHNPIKKQPAMNTTQPPARNYLAAAMPSLLHSRDEYIASVFGSAALGLVATMAALDAIDILNERLPKLIRGRLRRYVNDIAGRNGDIGHAERVTRAANAMLRHRQDTAWMADFGLSVGQQAQPHLMRCRNAIANALGRHPRVPDPNACAAVVLAQSLAHEQAAYVSRRAARFTAYTVETPDGQRNVAWLLRTMSCQPLDHALKQIADELLRPNLPPGFDLLADPSVATGCKAVLNTLACTDTWATARDKADQLNPTK